jgi:hypothetical protein
VFGADVVVTQALTTLMTSLAECRDAPLTQGAGSRRVRGDRVDLERER